MSYTIRKNDFGSYDLFDKKSEQHIEVRLEEFEARTLCRKLNLGAGFAEWTPAFFAPKFEAKFEGVL